jgi:hypothetical protein
VDEPAANPDGMFAALEGSELPTVAEQALLYALNQSDDAPDASLLGIHPDRVKQFLSVFLDKHNLSIVYIDDAQNFTDCTEAIEEKTSTLNAFSAQDDDTATGEKSGAKNGDLSNAINLNDKENSMELSELSIEVLESERPDLVEKLSEVAIEEYGDEAANNATESERERCLSIVKRAGELDLDAGVYLPLIEDGADSQEAELALREAKIAEREAALKAAETVEAEKDQTATVKANKNEGNADIAALATEIAAKEGISLRDATRRASKLAKEDK